MKIVRISALLAFIALLLAAPAMVLAQQAQPPRPAVFGGTATVNGAAASDGATVTAWIDGVQVASATVLNGGYAFSIPQPVDQSYDGKTITFKVDDATASETAAWQADGGGELNLSAKTLSTQPLVKVGLFGTVSAIMGSTIVLDSGEIVTADGNTKFVVQGLPSAGLRDIAVDNRVAVVAVKLPGGSLVAQEISVTYREPIRNSHAVGVVTDVQDRLVTLADNHGTPFTIQVPPGTTLAVGDFLTVVTGAANSAGVRPATAVVSVDDVLDRLSQDIERAVGRARESLKRLLGDNGGEQLTALLNSLDRASGRAQESLRTALGASQSHLDRVFSGAGVEGPFLRVRGFVTKIDSNAITINPSAGDSVTLDITGATKLKRPIAVGDFVEAKYNLDLVSAKIVIDTRSFKARGTVAAITPTGLALESGAFFAVDGNTAIQGTLAVGVQIQVEAKPVSGGFAALRINVKESPTERRESRPGSQGEPPEERESKLMGTVTALSPTELELDGLVTVLLTAGTEIEDLLTLGARVKIDAVLEDGSYVAREIEVKEAEEEAEKEDEDSGLEFEGLVTAISDGSIEVDGFGPILLTADTITKGLPVLGAEVEIKARRLADGSIAATRLKAEDELKVHGVIGAFSPTQVVLADGRAFIIDDGTGIRGSPAIGARIEIKAKLQPDGSRLAERVEVESKFEIKGIVASIISSELVLQDGSSFALTAETRVRGALLEGAEVEVKAQVLPNGTVVATRIRAAEKEKAKLDREETRKLEFEGRVASFTATTLVLENGSVFGITGDTRTEGALAVGSGVEINARLSPDGTLIATKIESDQEAVEKKEKQEAKEKKEDREDDEKKEEREDDEEKEK